MNEAASVSTFRFPLPAAMLEIAVNSSGVVTRATWIDPEAENAVLDLLDLEAAEQLPHVAPVVRALQDYVAGKPESALMVPVDQPGSDFFQRIWKEMRQIPAGETLTYGELARRAGAEGASRAAGTACSRNQIVFFVPCHRVLPTSGKVGNYQLDPQIKRDLLQFEGATFR